MKFASVLALATALSGAQAFWIPGPQSPKEKPSPFKPSFPTHPQGFPHYPNTTFVKPHPPSPTKASPTKTWVHTTLPHGHTTKSPGKLDKEINSEINEVAEAIETAVDDVVDDLLKLINH